MKKTDLSKYKFHASSMGKLMTNAKNKSFSKDTYNSVKESTETSKEFFKSYGVTKSQAEKIRNSDSYADYSLSQTAKSYLKEIFIEEVYGRKNIMINNYVQKGTMVESETMKLYQDVTGTVYFKNPDTLENDFVVGTPDIRLPDEKFIKDIKSSYDLWTFSKVTKAKAKASYYWQLMTYMWLDGGEKSSLIYGLVNTPNMIKANEVGKLGWQVGDELAFNIIELNHTFDDIPAKERIKEYFFDFDQTMVLEMIDRIVLGREFLQGLSL